jgi:hypothetical protein
MPIGLRKTEATYRKKSNLRGHFVRNHVPQFKPLRHDG